MIVKADCTNLFRSHPILWNLDALNILQNFVVTVPHLPALQMMAAAALANITLSVRVTAFEDPNSGVNLPLLGEALQTLQKQKATKKDSYRKDTIRCARSLHLW